MKVFVVTSGKGGVGKTHVCVNLALEISKKNKTLLIDADLGLGNVDVVAGLSPQYSLMHLITGQASIKQVLMSIDNLDILPATTGIKTLAELSEFEKTIINKQFPEIFKNYKYIFIDTAAGIHSAVTEFFDFSEEIILVINPEPASIQDAFGISSYLLDKKVYVLVNKAYSAKEASTAYNILSQALFKNYAIVTEYLGFIPDDKIVRQAAISQIPAIKLNPNSSFSQSIKLIAAKLTNTNESKPEIKENKLIKNTVLK